MNPNIRTTEVKRRNFSITVETFFDQFGEVDTTYGMVQCNLEELDAMKLDSYNSSQVNRDAFRAMPIHPVFQREKLYEAAADMLLR